MRSLIPVFTLTTLMLGACGPVTLTLPSSVTQPPSLRPSSEPLPSSQQCIFPSTTPVLANSSMGIYDGILVPSGIDNEDVLTRTMDQLATNATQGGQAADLWTTFQCTYPDAYRRWAMRGTMPSPTPSQHVSPQPSPSATSNGIPISGAVYDEEGAPVDGALVEVTSLAVSNPYTSVATTSQGAWGVNGVPKGVQLEIVARKDGWTMRRRVGSFQSDGAPRYIVNFGGRLTNPDGTADAGQAYFISDYPEIESVRVRRDERWHVTVRVSEGLGDVNRRRLENALCVLPANSAAADDQPLLGDFSRASIPPKTNLDAIPGALRKGGDITVAWNVVGNEATMTLPLSALNQVPGARYQVLLASAFDDERIADENENELGLTSAGNWSGTVAKGHPILAAFRASVLGFPLQTSGPARWSATHQDAIVFDLGNI